MVEDLSQARCAAHPPSLAFADMTIFRTAGGRLRPGWYCLLAFFALMATTLVGITLDLLLRLVPGLPETLHFTIPVLAVAAIAPFLVAGARRFIDHVPGFEPGLTRPRTALPHFLTGLAIGVGVIIAADAVCVALGVAAWHLNLPADRLIPFVLGPLLAQAVPEELWYRGYLFRNLSAALPPWTAFALTTLAFGAIHLISNSEATGIGEKLLYMVQAAAFGALLLACRIIGKNLWLPIGAHAGHNMAMQTFITYTPGLYTVLLLTETTIMIITAGLLLFNRRAPALTKSIP
ncbi:type II CAAX prenyl endopeptidase Rce1 family protein [Sphaerisporangium viridialbum]|uniref:CPBP family intramembrane glutamic endopeptidase n=1 Tax=Sphaerisporangium viridialbum TaxID=46189 RepID=UPI003C75B8A2